VRLVAQVSKSAVSPTSKSAGRGYFHGPQVWKPAIRQTWKSALRHRCQVAPCGHGGWVEEHGDRHADKVPHREFFPGAAGAILTSAGPATGSVTVASPPPPAVKPACAAPLTAYRAPARNPARRSVSLPLPSTRNATSRSSYRANLRCTVPPSADVIAGAACARLAVPTAEIAGSPGMISWAKPV
jgi:hypothetical protein